MTPEKTSSLLELPTCLKLNEHYPQAYTYDCNMVMPYANLLLLKTEAEVLILRAAHQLHHDDAHEYTDHYYLRVHVVDTTITTTHCDHVQCSLDTS